MEITSKINDTTYRIEIDGAIVGTQALELDELIRSVDFTRLGINNLIFNLAKTSMIDSIGIEAINYTQKQGLRVSILNPQGLVKDMLDWASLTGRLAPLQIIYGSSKTLLHLQPVRVAMTECNKTKQKSMPNATNDSNGAGWRGRKNSHISARQMAGKNIC